MLKQINTGDQNLQLIQNNVDTELVKIQQATQVTTKTVSGNTSFIKEITSNPFIGGNILVFSLTSGQDNLIQHGLGHPVNYWLILGQDTNSTVWSPTTSSIVVNGINSSTNNTLINLRCSTTCNVKVWVN